jgi:hypothetical protein
VIGNADKNGLDDLEGRRRNRAYAPANRGGKMRHVVVVAGLIALACYRDAAACSKDAFEPDSSAPTGAVLVGGTAQQRNFCDDAEDWMSINVCPGRAYSLDTSALGAAADTLIELYAGDGTTLLYADEEPRPDRTGHLAWVAASSESGTLHARVRQRDGTHGDLREYEIHLTGDTSPCALGVMSVTHVPNESLSLQAIAQSVDGGFVSVGTVSPPGGPTDLDVTRWSTDGTIAWSRRLGNGTSLTGVTVTRTVDGGFATITQSLQPSGSVIAKLTDDGTVAWQRFYGAGYDDALVGIAAASDGSIYAAGYLDSPASAGGFDGWLVKLDSLGTPAWSLRVGGVRDEFLLAVQPLENGGVIAAGSALSAGGDYDAMLLDVSSAGAIVKQTVFHTSAAQTEFHAVHALAGGGYLVGGVHCPAVACQALLMKLTDTEAITWQRTLKMPQGLSHPTADVGLIDTLQDGSIYAHVVRQDGNDEPIMTGWDPNGTLLWQTTLGAGSGGVTGIVADDGGIAVAHATIQNARLVRADATGHVPFCASVAPATGVPDVPALTASTLSLGSGFLVEPAPVSSLAITSPVRSVETTCPCVRTMSTPINVTGRSNTTISWANDGFGPYDVVRGDLATLQATGGDFTAALNAIPSNQQCLAQNTLNTVVTDTYVQPAPDNGYFYLVRGDNTGTTCPEVYDETSHQLGHRDPEVSAATGACP